MLYSRTNTLEDRIVELTCDQRLTLKSLHAELDKGSGLSLRAVYKSVNKLIDAGVLIKIGKRVIINQEWARGVSEMLNSESAPNLSNNERAVYTFTSMEHLDACWKKIMLPLEYSVLVKEIFVYNPHDFWAYVPNRKGSVDLYYRHFSDTKRYGFFTIGGNTLADTQFKRAYQNEHLQIDLGDIKVFRRTDHVTILKSMIITVRLAKGIAEQIDKLYASGEAIEKILPEIIRIAGKPGKIQFLIENNPAKAEKLKRELAKNFYFRGVESPV